MTHRDSWHTVTVELDGDEPDYTLTHPDTCKFEDAEFLGETVRHYFCLTANEYYGPDESWPNAPGTYQVRGHGHMWDYGDGLEWDGGLEWEHDA